MAPPRLTVYSSCVVRFGASVTCSGAILNVSDGVTYPSGGWTLTIAAVAGIAPNTPPPSEPVVPSTVVGCVVSTPVYSTLAATPGTPSSGEPPLTASTSSAEPVGGVMMLDCSTLG